jgi:hypothetical protein
LNEDVLGTWLKEYGLKEYELTEQGQVVLMEALKKLDAYARERGISRKDALQECWNSHRGLSD